MDVIQFQEKLRNICELGKQNGNMLTHEQIREHFASTDLETSQMLKVLQYLKLQGIMIEGDTAPVETEEVGETEPESKGTSTPLTSEEEAYLKDYLAEVSNGKEVSPEMLHTLFESGRWGCHCRGSSYQHLSAGSGKYGRRYELYRDSTCRFDSGGECGAAYGSFRPGDRT